MIQEGLEIHANATVTMPGKAKHHLLVENYKEIVNKRYGEPKDEEVLGLFLVLPEPPVGQAGREIRDLKKARNGEGRPRKTITDKVKASDSFFVKSWKRTKARLKWLWKKDTFDVWKICNINV